MPLLQSVTIRYVTSLPSFTHFRYRAGHAVLGIIGVGNDDHDSLRNRRTLDHLINRPHIRRFLDSSVLS